MDFSTRATDLETMDDLHCSGPVVAQTLRELEFINKWLGGNHVTLQAVKVIAKKKSLARIRIIDVGCGSGDMLLLLRRWARRKNLPTELTGVDANPNIIALAQIHCNQYSDISLEAVDILSSKFKALETDILIGTLFFHHFTQTQLTDFFAQLKEQVRVAIIINDLHRHPLAYYSIKWLTALFSKSEMVKSDAPLSVRRGFSRRELETVLRNAGYDQFQISWKWAFRWQVIVQL
jgi:2-polyprenyl-3-methyl-5-hydroxy-6-metoxy-1,4-benzoquinol methylase